MVTIKLHRCKQRVIKQVVSIPYNAASREEFHPERLTLKRNTSSMRHEAHSSTAHRAQYWMLPRRNASIPNPRLLLTNTLPKAPCLSSSLRARMSERHVCRRQTELTAVQSPRTHVTPNCPTSAAHLFLKHPEEFLLLSVQFDRSQHRRAVAQIGTVPHLAERGMMFLGILKFTIDQLGDPWGRMVNGLQLCKWPSAMAINHPPL